MTVKKLVFLPLLALVLLAGCSWGEAGPKVEFPDHTLTLRTIRRAQYTVCASAQDPVSGCYAVVAHTAAPAGGDGTDLPSSIQVQTFDAQGEYRDTFLTTLLADSFTMQYDDCQFSDGVVRFYQSPAFDADCFILDTEAKTAQRTYAVRQERAPSEEVFWQTKFSQAKEHAARVQQAGDWLLALDAQRDPLSGACEVTARMLNAAARQEETLTFHNDDPVVTANLLEDRAFPPVITFTPEEQAATLRICKVTFSLDFARQAVSTQTAYLARDLSRNSRVTTSPDGSTEIYVTHYDRNKQLFRGDLVAYHRASGEIVYLGPTTSLSDEVVFVGNDGVLINRLTSLSLLDVHTGQELPSAPQFEYTNYTTPGQQELLGIMTIGIAYDPQRELMLVAYRNTFHIPDNVTEDSYPLTLAVFERDGSLRQTIETGFQIQSYSPSLNLNRVYIQPDETGATLSLGQGAKAEELGHVDY